VANIQALLRKDADPRKWNPTRDVAHNFPWLWNEVLGRILAKETGITGKIRRKLEVSDDEVLLACMRLSELVTTATKNRKESLLEALDRVRWFELSPEAHCVIAAEIGIVMIGAYYTGVRDATEVNEKPATTYPSLFQAGFDLRKFLLKPRWRLRLERFWQRLKTAWSVFISGGAQMNNQEVNEVMELLKVSLDPNVLRQKLDMMSDK
jgi:hypothetical protein